MPRNNNRHPGHHKAKKSINCYEQSVHGRVTLSRWVKYFVLIAFLSLSCKKNQDSFSSQPPETPQFNVLCGDSGGDVIYSIIKSLDTGYIAVGDQQSKDGLLDVWVVKL